MLRFEYCVALKILHTFCRCVDYLQVSRGGGGFGVIETCGNTIPSILSSQLDSGTYACMHMCHDVCILDSATCSCIFALCIYVTGSGKRDIFAHADNITVELQTKMQQK